RYCLCAGSIEIERVACKGINNCGSAGVEDAKYADSAGSQDYSRAAARAADGQVVEIEDRDGLRARAVEIDRVACDRVARGCARCEGARNSHCSGWQNFVEIVESQVTVIRRDYVLAVTGLAIDYCAGSVAG